MDWTGVVRVEEEEVQFLAMCSIKIRSRITAAILKDH